MRKVDKELLQKSSELNQELLGKFADLNDDDFEHQLVYKLAEDIGVYSKLSEESKFLLATRKSYSNVFVLMLCEFLVIPPLILKKWDKAVKAKGGENSAKKEKHDEAYRCWEDWQADKSRYKNQEAFLLAMQIKLGVSRQGLMGWLKTWKTLQKGTNT